MSERYIRGKAADRSMSDAEVFSYLQMVMAQHINGEDSFLQHQAGLLDAASWTTDEAALRWTCMASGSRAVWRMVGPNFGAGYRAYVDRISRETSAQNPTLGAGWTEALDAASS